MTNKLSHEYDDLEPIAHSAADKDAHDLRPIVWQPNALWQQ